MSIFSYLSQKKSDKGFGLLALIDPDKKNDLKLDLIISRINNSPFDAILVGGSQIQDNLFEKRISYIKSNTSLPLLSFPGSSNQISKQIESILYLNLISGRNPKYLIEEQVKGAHKINKLNIETIPTAYILLDGGNSTSVTEVSSTNPLKMDDKDYILAHALAGQFMGNKLVYFDCGSGAEKSMKMELLRYVSENIEIPIIVGGGIKTYENAKEYYLNGSSFIVIGNALEEEKFEF